MLSLRYNSQKQNRTMEYKTYIFDLDGTLLDTLADLAASCNYALRCCGMPERSIDEVRRFVGNGVRMLMVRAVPGGETNADFERALSVFRSHYLEHSLDTTRPYPGVMEMLEEDTGIVIGRVCISNAVPEDEAYERLVELCQAREVPIYRLKAGDSISAYNMEFEVLHPSDGYQAASRNACSLVMKLSIKDNKDGDSFEALLTGDVEADGEYAVADELAKSMENAGIDLYKAAHHGSRSSNTEELINEAKPHFAIISCGENNSYGHPHAEALENFQNVGSRILMTKDTGAIMIQIKDG